MAVKGAVKTDLVGKKFGKLTVTDKFETRNRRAYWYCECECGGGKYIYRGSLVKGVTTSCGCTVATLGGLSKDRLYKIWWGMKERCYDKNHHQYQNYGGKGITLCDEWQDFLNFHIWALDNGYKDNLTIDREDSNDIYKPSNCRWLTKSENTAHTNRTTHRRKTKFMYYGISPTGEYYEFANANQFAKEHELRAGILRDMANGRKYTTKLYQGWKFGFTDKPNL
ncbi:hypothetical protein M4D55_04545 [Metabacillus idriensis]|uniref:hypothetical protein n=1 Tax=Metabacillus idriensis TaxID=324768 RepID=UPI002040BEF6|nr:hypothetical protein [Metabacillus idriensis]MCM3595052.1 hypothetical protein [Metabacillus idriensis]